MSRLSEKDQKVRNRESGRYAKNDTCDLCESSLGGVLQYQTETDAWNFGLHGEVMCSACSKTHPIQE